MPQRGCFQPLTVRWNATALSNNNQTIGLITHPTRCKTPQMFLHILYHGTSRTATLTKIRTWKRRMQRLASALKLRVRQSTCRRRHICANLHLRRLHWAAFLRTASLLTLFFIKQRPRRKTSAAFGVSTHFCFDAYGVPAIRLNKLQRRTPRHWNPISAPSPTLHSETRCAADKTCCLRYYAGKRCVTSFYIAT